MKSLIFSSYLFACGLSGIAQTLQIGNAAVGSTSHGSLFRTPSGQSLYEAPINSGLTTIYESQFWVGYRQSGVKHAIMPLLTSPLIGAQTVYGPHTNLNAYSPVQLNGAFNKTWVVYSDSLDYHRANYLQNPYTPPKCVSEYVAVGDTAKGVHPFLLPFEAADDDGLYSWQRGDVPVIGGKKSLFALYSDRGVSKPAGNSETDLNVSVELYEHPLASVSDAHANSVFARFRVTNTGPTKIDSLLIGLVADFDIGSAEDDYVGTDVPRNMIFGMNYLNSEPLSGYGQSTPAMGVMSLGKSISRSVRYNPGITQASQHSMPTNVNQQFNYFNGIGPDGAALPQFYASGDPLAKTGMLDDTLVVNFLDRAMILFLPVDSLTSGSTSCFDFVYVFARSGNHKQSLQLLRDYCDEISANYLSNYQDCGIAQFVGLNEVEEPQNLSIYPNPTFETLNLVLEDFMNENVNIQMFNEIGQVVLQANFVSGDSLKKIDVSTLQSGLYVLEVKSKSKVGRFKVVKI
jgi:hypothetical protein